ncbi:MAG: TIGR02302 family protein [Hyphomicrobiales bacterium]|nr:MAG: TIGR02302 family protein [Hyphomicrobiales bacterium]
MPQGHDQSSGSGSKSAVPLTLPDVTKLLKKLVFRGRLVLFWEALWPRLLPLLGLGALFLIVSWFGLWLGLPPIGRIAGIIVFSIAGIAALWPLLKIKIPSKKQSLKRIEKMSDTRHRPLASFDDRPAAIASNSAEGQQLWRAHQQRLIASLSQLKTGIPNPDASKIDPFQLRALAVLLLVIAFAYGGNDRIRRIVALTDSGIEQVPALARIDAWVTPPDYTRKAPIFLTRAEITLQNQDITVPAGSVFSLQTDAADQLKVTLLQGGTRSVLSAGAGDELAGLSKYETVLEEAVEITVSSSFGAARSWRFVVVPDMPPEISFVGLPKFSRSGAIELDYALKDDYGITKAEVEFTPKRQINTGADTKARPLYDPPEMALSLPRRRVKEGNGHTLKNLTDHPWAGIDVSILMRVYDEVGQQGASASLEMQLPIRSFRERLARAIVEQRQNLALDANQAQRVVLALDALLFAPEIFLDDMSVFLAMNAVKHRIIDARDDDDLREVVDLLWEIALVIENGDLSDVERELREAQDALKDALENDASNEEIAQLVDELREAMQRYMEALAREMQENPTAQQMPSNPNMQMVTPQDLAKMMDQIENLAKSGSRDAAREMLAEMQRMMENMQRGRPQMSQQQQQMQQMMQDLGELIDRQQALMDQTFTQQQQQLRRQQLEGQQSQNQQPQNQQPGQDQQGQKQQGQQPPGQQDGQEPSDGESDTSATTLPDPMAQLQEGQAELQAGLQELMDQLAQNGLDAGEQMDEADGAMGDAAQQLGEGNSSTALGSQARALQALRDGAQSMMQQFAQRGSQRGQQQQAPGMENGQGQQPGQPGGLQSGNDPLGRMQRSRGTNEGSTVKVPGEIDIQRAREILDAIRKRLGDLERPDLELDYLERLLPLQ